MSRYNVTQKSTLLRAALVAILLAALPSVHAANWGLQTGDSLTLSTNTCPYGECSTPCGQSYSVLLSGTNDYTFKPTATPPAGCTCYDITAQPDSSGVSSTADNSVTLRETSSTTYTVVLTDGTDSCTITYTKGSTSGASRLMRTFSAAALIVGALTLF